MVRRKSSAEAVAPEDEESAHKSQSGLPCTSWIYARRPPGTYLRSARLALACGPRQRAHPPTCFPAPASHPYGASCHLVHNINVFGALGGFQMMRDRLYACFEAPAEVRRKNDERGRFVDR